MPYNRERRRGARVSAAHVARGTVRRVLVVEDDVEMRDAELAALGLAGYEPVCARSGREALARLRDGDRPQLILLDLQMPGVDGETFRAEQINDPDLADIPVVIVSALPDAAESARRLHLRLLPKPFDADTLIDVVRRAEAA
jgi:CheY-like chemotaxis protein